METPPCECLLKHISRTLPHPSRESSGNTHQDHLNTTFELPPSAHFRVHWKCRGSAEGGNHRVGRYDMLLPGMRCVCSTNTIPCTRCSTRPSRPSPCLHVCVPVCVCVYSGIPIADTIRGSSVQAQVSSLERCPHFRGIHSLHKSLHSWYNGPCPL